MRPVFFILAAFLVLSCGYSNYENDYEYRYYSYEPWASSQIDSEVDACVKGALAGQTNYPELEADSKVFCSCLYKKISDKYSYSTYVYNKVTLTKLYFSDCYK